MTDFKKITEIVDTLMSENGCPWDKIQTRESLKPYLVEEVYETLEALDSNDPEQIKDELGDLLYQILFHAKISENRGEFNIEQVVTQWEEIKKQEKSSALRKSVLDGVPKHLPGLLRAQKLQKKAAKHGFDWDEITDVFDKLDEEIAEFKEAVLLGKEADIEGELGDILFVLVNISKFKKIDAEEALRRTNNKFIQRFHYIEEQVAKRGKELKDTPLAELEQYWQQAKNNSYNL